MTRKAEDVLREEAESTERQSPIGWKTEARFGFDLMMRNATPELIALIEAAREVERTWYENSIDVAEAKRHLSVALAALDAKIGGDR